MGTFASSNTIVFKIYTVYFKTTLPVAIELNQDDRNNDSMIPPGVLKFENQVE